jgi:hypothetical protein
MAEEDAARGKWIVGSLDLHGERWLQEVSC